MFADLSEIGPQSMWLLSSRNNPNAMVLNKIIAKF